FAVNCGGAERTGAAARAASMSRASASWAAHAPHVATWATASGGGSISPAAHGSITSAMSAQRMGITLGRRGRSPAGGGLFLEQLAQPALGAMQLNLHGAE